MSKRVYFQRGSKLSRRTLLRGAGAAMALPWLSAMSRAFAAPGADQPPRRFVSMTLGLGLHADNLNPEQAGRGYKPSRYLEQRSEERRVGKECRSGRSQC